MIIRSVFFTYFFNVENLLDFFPSNKGSNEKILYFFCFLKKLIIFNAFEFLISGTSGLYVFPKNKIFLILPF